MRRYTAALGSAVFFLLAPGTVAGLIPWWLTGGWHADGTWPAMQIFGAVLVLAGVAVLVSSFVLFAVVGAGTPAPIAPPRHLVVRGPYRFVRNPMYVAIVSIILGQAAILGSVLLVWYAFAFWVVVAAFVLLYEEPTLRRDFGEEYDRYRRNVRAWIPLIRPWHPGHPAAAPATNPPAPR